MHMLSRNDLNAAELETVRISKNPTTVVAANGEVRTNETTVCVRELNLFVTVKLLEDTPAVLSLGKLCEDHGYSDEWSSGQKPHLIKHGRRIQCKTENYAPIVVPGLATGSSSSSTSTSPTSSPQDTVSSTSRPASIRSETVSKLVPGDPLLRPAETEKPNKHEDTELVRGDPLHDLPERL